MSCQSTYSLRLCQLSHNCSFPQFLITFSFDSIKNWRRKKPSKRKTHALTHTPTRMHTTVWWNCLKYPHHTYIEFLVKRMKWNLTFIWDYAWMLSAYVRCLMWFALLLWCDRHSFDWLDAFLRKHFLISNKKKIWLQIKENINFVCIQSVSFVCVCVHTRFHIHECVYYVYLFTMLVYFLFSSMCINI